MQTSGYAPVIAIVVNIVVNLLPLLGITLSSEDVDKFIQVGIALVTGIYLWIDSVKNKKALVGAQHVNALGGRKV